MYKHILAAIDLSAASSPILETAKALGNALTARVSVCHVYPLPEKGYWPSEATAEMAERFIAGLAEQKGVDSNQFWRALVVDEVEKLIHGAFGAIQPTVHVIGGSPHEQIVALAAKEKIDLIVMATHGRTGIGHLLIGSIAERVIRTAPCAVHVIRTPPHR